MKALLKLSGQVLKGSSDQVVDRDYLWKLAGAIKSSQDAGHQLAIVVGGGNIYRHAANRRDPRDEHLNPILAHGRGLIGTLFNALWMQDALQALGARSSIFALAFADAQFVQPYTDAGAQAAFNQGNVVILGGGTGKPGVSSDCGATMLAPILGIETILKATHTVDGVYTADPARDPNAQKLDELTYERAITDGLAIMDDEALRRAKEANLTTIVFSIADPKTLTRVLAGETIGSVIRNE